MTRRQIGRFRPALDCLEGRLVMTQVGLGTMLPVAAMVAPLTLPVDVLDITAGPVVLASSPAAIDVDFHQAVGAAGSSRLDFRLLAVGADGTTSTQPGVGLADLERIEPVQGTDGVLVLTPSSTLPAGEYRLILLGSGPLGQRVPLAATATDPGLMISDFKVEPAGIAATPTAPAGSIGAATSIVPVVPATTVEGLQVDRADPDSAAATGLTLRLSGPISVDALLGSAGSAVGLLDALGRAWTLTPTNYDPVGDTLSFVFDQDLPAGTYSLVAGSGGLFDPQGLALTSTGQAGGVLGQFTEPAQVLAPDDLGPITPADATSGRTASLSVATDGTASGRFVIMAPGVYHFAGISGAEGLGFQSVDLHGASSGTVASLAVPGGVDAYLAAGVYRMNLSGIDPNSARIAITIRGDAFGLDSLLGEAIGQGVAMPTRLLVGPADAGVGLASSDPSSATPAAARPAPASGSTAAQGLDDEGRESAAGLFFPSGAALTIGQPLGRPSSTGAAIGVVAPSATGGPAGLAMVGSTMPSGLFARSPAPGSRREAGADPDPEVGAARPPGPAERVGDPRFAGREVPESSEPEGVQASLDRQGQFVRTASEVWDILTSPERPEAEVAAQPAPGDGAELAGPRAGDKPGNAMASFASPIGIGVAVLIAIQYRQRRLERGRLAAVPTSTRMPLRGPHRSIRTGPKVGAGC